MTLDHRKVTLGSKPRRDDEAPPYDTNDLTPDPGYVPLINTEVNTDPVKPNNLKIKLEEQSIMAINHPKVRIDYRRLHDDTGPPCDTKDLPPDPVSNPASPIDSNRVDHPAHYTSSDIKCPLCDHLIECWDISENFNSNLGNVIKYVWRCDLKGNPIIDLKKAKAYLEREIDRREELKK